MNEPQSRTPPLSSQGPSESAETLPTQLDSPPVGQDMAETLIPATRDILSPVEVPGLSLPGYELLGELGRGGMGVVYKARQKGLGRLVALKMILHADHAGSADRLRFQREAESLAQLKHEHIIQIHEVGEHEGKPFICLEYVEGGSLDRRLNGTPLPPREAARLVEQLANAMEAAHAAGIVHRDLKPANVLLSFTGSPPASAAGVPEGRRPALAGGEPLNGLVPKITDFGLAKRQDVAGLSVSGAIMGTPSYMAPEQAAGKGNAVDARADIYALGAILYECLTGRPPFRAATPMQTVFQVLHAEPVAVRLLQPGAPRDLETICHKCLQKEPGRRYVTARALAQDLLAFQENRPVAARPVGSLERAWRWCRRNPAVASLLLLVLLSLTAGTTVSVLFALDADAERANAETKADEAETSARQARAAEGREKERADEADSERRKATKAQATATTEAKAARAAERLEKRRAYGVSMLLTQAAWERHQVGLYRQMLEQHRPGKGQDEDIPGFEWYFWNCHIQRGHLTLAGHKDKVFSVRFRPDGKRLVSGSLDKTVKVWDAATGQLTAELVHETLVTSVCYSPDGKQIASGCWDGTIKVWNAETSQEEMTLEKHTSIVESVCYSPDGKQIVSAGKDKVVKVWDTTTGRELATLRGHAGTVWSVCYSPDGKQIASGSDDMILKVWDAETYRPTAALKGHSRGVHAVCYSPDGKQLASGSWDMSIKLWDARTYQEAATLNGHASGVYGVCFSPDGKQLVSGSDDRFIKVWDVETRQPRHVLKGHTDAVYGVCFSPDGKSIASACWDNTIKVWDAEKGQEPSTVKVQTSPLYRMGYSLDGKRLFTLAQDHMPGRDSIIKLWDMETGQELASHKVAGPPIFELGLSPDGKRVAFADIFDRTVMVWNTDTDRRTVLLKGFTKAISALSFSPDGKWIASRCADTSIIVSDAQTGQERNRLKGPAGNVRQLWFSPDGNRIVSSNQDKTLKVWSVLTGQETVSLQGDRGGFLSVCFSPDGKRIASTCYPGILPGIEPNSRNRITIWDAWTGQVISILNGHSETVAGICFSPDGKRIASASSDKTVKIWDPETGQEVTTLKGHSAPVLGVRFSADGERIFSASSDGTVRMWEGNRARADSSRAK